MLPGKRKETVSKRTKTLFENFRQGEICFKPEKNPISKKTGEIL